MADRSAVVKVIELPVSPIVTSGSIMRERHKYELTDGKHKNLRNHANYTNNNSLQKMIDDSTLEEGCYITPDVIDNPKHVRFIKKSGHCNVSHSNLSDKPRRFIADIFTTGVDLQWRWNLFVFSAAFILSWLIFGLLYWLGSYIHGDFDFHPSNSTFKPCIKELDIKYQFTSTFLFSLETQTTIGYGFRHVTEECAFAIIMVVVQSVFGCILDAFMIGLIMAKISRPKKRAETLLFSENAVINVRDGKLCFMVRVGNLRKSHLVEATIRMQYIYSRETAEGEYIPLEQVDLKLDLKNDSDRLFLVTPQTISHPIDEDSPLWNLYPKDLRTADFEIIVILEGMVEATGMTTQARASYLPSEILWGYRFQNMISLSRNNAYKVNFKNFHNTYHTDDAPQMSAKELHQSANANIRAVLETGLTLRGKKPQRPPSSCSSSSRSSVQSIGLAPPSGSDVKDYVGSREVARSNSNRSLTRSNKPSTSTTSLSDLDENKSINGKRKLSDRSPRLPSSSSSLIDLSTPANVEDAKADEQKIWQSANVKDSAAKKADGSSEDIQLVQLNSPNLKSCEKPVSNSSCISEEQIDKAFNFIPIENGNPLCV